MNARAARLVLAIMRSSFLLCISLSLVGGPALVGCDVKVGNDGGMSVDITQGRAEDEWKRTYTLAKGGHLEIVSGGGPVNVVSSSGAAVEIQITREARASNDEAAQQALKEETITEEVTPERIKVETRRTRRDDSGPLGRRRISTTFQVLIPAGLKVSVTGENADVSLVNVQGDFTLQNTNGGFRGHGVSGSIAATTVNGVVDFDIEQVTGEIRATTINGPVRLGLPRDVNATLEARTVNGGVTVDSDLPFTADERERLRLTGRFGKGGPAITLNTTNGPIRVTEPGDRGRGRGGRVAGEPVVIERRLQER